MKATVRYAAAGTALALPTAAIPATRENARPGTAEVGEELPQHHRLDVREGLGYPRAFFMTHLRYVVHTPELPGCARSNCPLTVPSDCSV